MVWKGEREKGKDTQRKGRQTSIAPNHSSNNRGLHKSLWFFMHFELVIS